MNAKYICRDTYHQDLWWYQWSICPEMHRNAHTCQISLAVGGQVK